MAASLQRVLARLWGPRAKLLRDDLYEVTFRYRPNRPLRTVCVAGSFNDWDPASHPMNGPDEDGRYTLRLPLRRGTYPYKFVLDGQTWLADPENVHRAGPSQDSVLSVGVAP